MNKIMAFIAALIGTAIGFKTSLFHPILDWIKTFVMEDIPSIIWPLVPSGLASTIKDFDIAGVANIVGDMAWFIPFWQVLSVYFVAFALCGFVLLVRYIVGWIPTIEG